jgi:hypothetical protein
MSPTTEQASNFSCVALLCVQFNIEQSVQVSDTTMLNKDQLLVTKIFQKKLIA